MDDAGARVAPTTWPRQRRERRSVPLLPDRGVPPVHMLVQVRRVFGIPAANRRDTRGSWTMK